jgi:hypothetical protein
MSSQDTPFGHLAAVLESFNKNFPDKQQPITNEILGLLNELTGIGQTTQWIDAGWFDRIEKYTKDFDALPDLNTSIKHLKIDFGSKVVKVESDLLLEQIRRLLKEHLTRQHLRYNKKKEGNKSPWLRTITKGKAILEKLYSLGLTDDFFAHYFQVDPETFKRKRQDVISIRTVKKENS